MVAVRAELGENTGSMEHCICVLLFSVKWSTNSSQLRVLRRAAGVALVNFIFIIIQPLWCPYVTCFSFQGVVLIWPELLFCNYGLCSALFMGSEPGVDILARDCKIFITKQVKNRLECRNIPVNFSLSRRHLDIMLLKYLFHNLLWWIST